MEKTLNLNSELPTLTSSSYMSTAYNGFGDAVAGAAAPQQMVIGSVVPAVMSGEAWLRNMEWRDNQDVIFQHQQQAFPRKFPIQQKEPSMTRRMVQIFIVDPNESVPLVDSLVYSSSEPFLTDLTDQELFYDLDIKQLLAAHNEKRKNITNKAITEKSVCLEPARIRDLKMNITTVAQF